VIRVENGSLRGDGLGKPPLARPAGRSSAGFYLWLGSEKRRNRTQGAPPMLC
jgi:hypothetical protein